MFVFNQIVIKYNREKIRQIKTVKLNKKISKIQKDQN